jgi:hypothetical protein
MMGPSRRSNHNFQYQRQLLNDNLCIHVLRMHFLHLRQLTKEDHWTPEILETLQFYRPRDQIVVNKCNQEQVPIAENLPLSFRENEGNIQVHTKFGNVTFISINQGKLCWWYWYFTLQTYLDFVMISGYIFQYWDYDLTRSLTKK